MSTLDTSGRVLTGWNPEEPENWSAKIAWTTLAITTFSLMLGFTVWFLPSAVAPRLNDIGFHLTKNQIYWITSMPGLSCAALRLIYMFLPATIGARKMIGWSSLLYILPMLGWFFAVQNHNTSFGVLLALSFACGIGAATFSGYMPSTGFYFPKRLAGTALGLQGGLGNMGMSVIQLAAPFLMSISLFGLTWVAPHHEGAPMVVNATVFFLPWSLIAAFLTFRYIKDVPLKANIKEQMDIFGNLDTWLMTVLYIMTFGVFSGFAAQTANIINNNYGAASDLPRGSPPPTCPREPPTPSSAPSSAPSCASHGVPCATASAGRSGPSSPRSAWPSPWGGADTWWRVPTTRPTSPSSWWRCWPCSSSLASATPRPSSRCR